MKSPKKKSFYEARITLLGSALSPSEQENAKRAYVHRYTREHVPQWARTNVPQQFGETYPLQFDSDADWLAHTLFAVKPNGTLDPKFDECHSTATWPDNPELRK